MIFTILLIFLAGMGLHLVWLYLIRPLVIQKLCYSMRAIKDDLKLAALAGEISPDEKGYPVLIRHLSTAEVAVETIDFGDLLFLNDNFLRFETLQAVKTLEESSPTIKAMHRKAIQLCIAAIIVNSPLVSVAAAVLFFLALFVKSADILTENLRHRTFAASECSTVTV